MAYRIDKISEDQITTLVLAPRSEKQRRITVRILGTLFIGLGLVGIVSSWWRLEFWRIAEGALLPILLGLSISLVCLGAYFLTLQLAFHPQVLRFDDKARVLHIGQEIANTVFWRIPYGAIHSFVIGRTKVQSQVGHVSHKRVRLRVLMVLKNLAAWTLTEHHGHLKEKRPREQVLGFLSTVRRQVRLENDPSEPSILDVNEAPSRFFVEQRINFSKISWKISPPRSDFWGLGVPSGLLLGLFFAWNEMTLNRVLLAAVIVPVFIWTVFLANRIANNLRFERQIEMSSDGFKAHFTGFAGAFRKNISTDWIGVFRFEPPEIGRVPALIIVPRERHESDTQHYEELQDEHVAMDTQYRASRARPLREKWVKAIGMPGLSCFELTYLTALLNARLEELRASEPSGRHN